MDKRKHIIGNFQIFQKNIVQPIILTTIITANKKPTAVQNKLGSREKRKKNFVLDRFKHSSKTIPT